MTEPALETFSSMRRSRGVLSSSNLVGSALISAAYDEASAGRALAVRYRLKLCAYCDEPFNAADFEVEARPDSPACAADAPASLPLAPSTMASPAEGRTARR